MKEQSLIKNQAYSRHLLLLLLTASVSTTGFALESDKNQPIEVEADSAELDDIRNVSIYTGQVVLTRGTIRMTAR